jgi:thymidylate synthase
MTLAPCHVLFQFHVRPSIDSDQPDELSLAMYQRSADVGCGVPFNVASYALLLRIVAHVCQLEPADLIIFMGDTHMYYNHVVQLREQSQRSPLPFPTLLIRDAVDQPLEAFTAQSFQLCDYLAHPAIVLPMAV